MGRGSAGSRDSRPHDAVETVPVGVVATAARAARRFLVAPRTFQDLVHDCTTRRDGYQRALHHVERRTPELCMLPAPPRVRDTGVLPNANAFDPWALHPAAVPDATRVICPCGICGGSRRVMCGDCGGGGRVRCRNCGGSGSVRGQRGPRRCTVCRGGGTVGCGVCRTTGTLPCAMCQAGGKVEAWLAVTTRRFSAVEVSPPDSAAAGVHQGIRDPADFEGGKWVNRLVDDTGTGPTPSNLPYGLRPELDRRTDRILDTRVQTFEAAVFRLRYRACFAAGHVEVAGEPPAVSTTTDWRPLKRRAVVAGVAIAVLTIAALVLYGAYRGRHEWFARFGTGWLVLLAGLVLAAAGAVALAAVLLPRRAWTATRVGVPAGVAGLAVAWVAIAWAAGQPSAAAAQTAFVAGDEERASLEASAVRETGLDPGGGAVVLDQIHFAHVKSAGSLTTLAKSLSEPWFARSQRDSALDILHARAAAEIARLWTARDQQGLDGVASAVRPVHRALAGEAAARAALLRLPACDECGCATAALELAKAAALPAADVDPAREEVLTLWRHTADRAVAAARKVSPTDPHALSRALEAAVAATTCRETIAAAPATPSARDLAAELQNAREAAVEADAKAAEAKRKADAAAEAQRKAEQDAADRRAAAAAPQRVRCGDGSFSPSCTCGGSLRGCCSHHGVAGCE